MLCGIMYTASSTTDARTTQIWGFFAFFSAIAATIQPSRATAVLLSVMSLPRGQPVQYAPKAYFCMIGPRIMPPAISKPSVQ